MKTFKFKANLKRPDGIGTWHYVDTPIQAEKEFGSKGKVPICGTIDAIPFAATLIPRGNGEHYIVLDKNIREQTGIEVGDEINLKVWKDNAERVVTVPDDFEESLSSNRDANAFFQGLAYSYKKAYVDWINSAKRESTRTTRIAKSVTLLADRKKLR